MRASLEHTEKKAFFNVYKLTLHSFSDERPMVERFRMFWKCHYRNLVGTELDGQPRISISTGLRIQSLKSSVQSEKFSVNSSVVIYL